MQQNSKRGNEKFILGADFATKCINTGVFIHQQNHKSILLITTSTMNSIKWHRNLYKSRQQVRKKRCLYKKSTNQCKGTNWKLNTRVFSWTPPTEPRLKICSAIALPRQNSASSKTSQWTLWGSHSLASSLCINLLVIWMLIKYLFLRIKLRLFLTIWCLTSDIREKTLM